MNSVEHQNTLLKYIAIQLKTSITKGQLHYAEALLPKTGHKCGTVDYEAACKWRMRGFAPGLLIACLKRTMHALEGHYHVRSWVRHPAKAPHPRALISRWETSTNKFTPSPTPQIQLDHFLMCMQPELLYCFLHEVADVCWKASLSWL